MRYRDVSYMPGNERKESAHAMAQLLASLDTTGEYGVPPLTAYERFNTAGGEVHGSSAVAQGARGYRGTIGAGFKFGGLWTGSPIKASASVAASAARASTSLVVLYRLAAKYSKKNEQELPIALAQLEGVSYNGTGTLKGGLSAGISFPVIAGIGASLTLKGNLGYSTSNLRSPAIQHFATAGRVDLAKAVDSLLVMELKKAAIAVLAHNSSWIKQHWTEVATDGAGVGLKLANAVVSEELKTSIKAQGKAQALAALRDLRKGSGWEWVFVGVVASGLTGGATVAINELLKPSNKSLEDGLTGLLKLIQTDRSKVAKTSQRYLELGEAINRVQGLKDGLFRAREGFDQLFHGHLPKNTGEIKPVDSNWLLSGGGSTLDITAWDWEISGKLAANAQAIGVGAVKASTTAPLIGQNSEFEFRLSGTGPYMLVQHTRMSLMHMNIETAKTLQFMPSGFDSLDTTLLKNMREHDVDVGDSKVRCFGALQYQSANIYVDTSAKNKPKTVLPAISGLTLGTSVRVGPLCAYADAIRELADGVSLPAGSAEQKLEEWIRKQVGCSVAQLQAFVKEAPLGAIYAESGSEGLTDKAVGRGHKLGYPSDTLLIEAAYISKKPHPKISNSVPLFDYMGFKDIASWRAVPGNFDTLVALRLRYRVQSPLNKMSKGTPYLGLSPFLVNFQFARETEAGQESIVTLYTRFADTLEDPEKNITQRQKFEVVPPAVVLFNRG